MQKPAALLRGDARLQCAPASVFGDPSSGTSFASCAAGMGKLFCTGSPISLRNRSHQLRLDSCPSTRGFFFFRCPLSHPGTRSSALRRGSGISGSSTGLALGKLFQKADVLQPSLQQTTGLGFPKPFPAPTQPGRPEPVAGDPQHSKPPANAPPLPPSCPSATGWWRKPQSKLKEPSNSPAPACKGSGC